MQLRQKSKEVRTIRVETDGFPDGGLGFRQAVAFPQHNGIRVEHEGLMGSQVNGVLRFLRGFSVLLAMSQTDRQHPVRSGIVGALRQCLSQLLLGQFVPRLFEQHESAL